MVPTLRRVRLMPSPMDAVDDLRREMGRWFGDVSDQWETSLRTLPTEVVETNEELRFMMEIPGMRLEDIDLTVENNILTVSGEKKEERKEGEGEGSYRLYERRYGHFERSFVLPQHANASQVDARYENGVLTVTFPKVEEAKPRRIEIRGGGHELGKGK
ncbi:MAG: Hsp20/alpha crystallin family protein [Gemmatimonadota bacterium]|jgi:HSP20 family protein